MMSFLQSMQLRYTTKKYDTTKKIDIHKIEELKEILRLSPSSINSQPWKFTFVSDTQTKQKLAQASFFNNEKILACDSVVVFSRINNIALFEKQIEQELPQRAVDYYKKFIQPQTSEQVFAWFGRQVYLALGVFLSACAQMDIDSTPMEGIEPLEYDKILNHKDYSTLVAVAIGGRDAEDDNQLSKKAKSRRETKQVIDDI